MSPDRQLVESALLVVRWQRGDREAFAEIVKLWERSLFFYLRRLAPTEADAWELLQETWLKLLRSLHKLRDPRTLPAYLYTTARHAAISRFRVKPPEVESYPEQLADDRSNDDVSAYEDAEQLRHALSTNCRFTSVRSSPSSSSMTSRWKNCRRCLRFPSAP